MESCKRTNQGRVVKMEYTLTKTAANEYGKRKYIKANTASFALENEMSKSTSVPGIPQSVKGYVIFVLFMMLPMLTFAQTILGIKVGENYTEAKRILRTRFCGRLSESSGNLVLYDFEMGDFSFKYGTLYFQWESDNGRFYKAIFETWATPSDQDILKSDREILKHKLESKYDIYEFKNAQGFKCYEFLGSDTDGITMHGSLELERCKGKDGIERLYLCLYYFPIAEFIDEGMDF